ncbi:hypothetical protein H4R34_001680 [Dimargaris verticillata]|uniref:Histidinol-phosphatase n=1 Tax=Dimargaris verticillata TaxID=2761393 RepID=A0A9W8EAQ1_9FUNG|nr:hypothetical protein H4R34_001680 [Dimargaris verticillata]
MPITLHSHSGQFCGHAHGTLVDVVKTAQEKGFRVLGLSEHVPRYRAQDLYDEERHLDPKALESTFEAYVTEARRLQKEYSTDNFTVLVGAETEYIHADSLTQMAALQKRYDLDYLVGSVHHVNEIPIDYSPALYDQALVSCGNSLEALFAQYFDHQYELITALHPQVIGHFDLCRLLVPRDHPLMTELSPALLAKVNRNIDAVVSYGGLFEVNSRAYKKGLPEAYPQRDILEIIKAKGGRFTLSDDSHGPNDVALHYAELYRYLKEMDVRTVYYIGTKATGVSSPNWPIALDKLFEGSPWGQ